MATSQKHSGLNEVKASALRRWPSIKGLYPFYKPPVLRVVLTIQSKYSYSDREVVDQITENPYYQYFVGLPGYQEEKPFDESMMVYFRKRVNADVLNEINLEFLEQEIEKEDDRNDPTDTSTNGKTGADGTADTIASEQSNTGTLMLDATCAPQQIAYPQDFQLLNDAREKLEQIDRFILFQVWAGKTKNISCEGT